MEIIQTKNYHYILNLDMDNYCMRYFEGNIGKKIEALCQKYHFQYIDWHQFVESGIGEIQINRHKVRIMWDDFPLGFSFETDDLNIIKIVENVILNEIQLFNHDKKVHLCK